MSKRTHRLLALALSTSLAASPVFSLMTAAPVYAEENAELTTVKRVNAIDYSKTYALAFKDEKKGSIRLANSTFKTNTYTGLSVDEVSATFTDDETLSVGADNLFQFVEGEGDTAALKCVSTGKYVSVSDSGRNVTLSDTPVYLNLESCAHFVNGTAFMLSNGNQYFNYSHSRQLVNSYDYTADLVSSPDQVHGNHMAIYEATAEKDPEIPEVKTAARADELKEGKAYIIAGGDIKKDAWGASGGVLNTSGSIAYLERSTGLEGFPDSLPYDENNLICVLPDGKGNAALYHTGLKKYIGLDVSKGTTDKEKRSILASDEPIMMKLETGEHPAGGTAWYFSSDDYYFNYSASRNGFCGYDFKADNETAGTNLYGNAMALYEVDYDGAPTLPEEPSDPIISYDGVISTILLTSDYQTWSEVPDYGSANDVPSSLTSVIQGIGQEMKEAGVLTLDGVLMAGDYSAFSGKYNYDADATLGVTSLKNELKALWPGLNTFYAIQGNHDSDTYAFNEGPSEEEGYMVYNINTRKNYSSMGSFPWNQGGNSWTKTAVERLAGKMEAWFESKAEAGDTRPIFINMHVPLHFSGRTSTMYSGDNVYSKILFDVINKYAEELNITVLFGHNHSNGWDTYLGGDAVFLKPGDTMLIPDWTKKSGSGTNTYSEETLNFTYLNAGYIGYYKDPQSNGSNAAGDLTSTLVQIYEDKVVYYRFDADGLHNLSDEGKNNSSQNYNDTSLIPSKYWSPAVASPAEVARKAAAEASLSLEGGSVQVGNTMTLSAAATRLPDADYTWSLSDESMAEISAEGKTATLKAKKAGDLSVTVKAVSGETELEATAKVTITAIPGEASVSINALPGSLFKGDTVTVSAAAAGMSAVDSISWSVSPEGIASVSAGDNNTASLTLNNKGQATLTVTVTGKDGAGNAKEVSDSVSFTVEDTLRYQRVSELEDGERYLLLGWSHQIGESLPGTGKGAVSADLSSGSTPHLNAVNIESANVSNTSDSFQGDHNDLLWTVHENNGKYAFQSVKTGKYMNLTSSSRAMSFSDEPVYLTVQSAPAAFSGASGQAIAISNGDYYLNYSRSRGGFLGYSSAGASVSEDHTSERNQYLLYKAAGEDEEKAAEMSSLTFGKVSAEVLFDAAPSQEQADALSLKVSIDGAPEADLAITGRSVDGNKVILSYAPVELSERQNASAKALLGDQSVTAAYTGEKTALSFEKLNAALAAAADLNTADYEDDQALKDFEAALRAARHAGSSTRTQDALDKAADDLDAARVKLNKKVIVPEVDTTALEKAIDAASAVDPDAYQANEAWTDFEKALADAKAALANPADQDAVNAAAAALETAQKALTPKQSEVKVDSSALKKAVEAAKALDPKAYEANDAWKAFESALAKAEAVLADPKDQAAVDAVAADLEKAQKALSPKQSEAKVDTAELAKAVKAAQAKNLALYQDGAAKEAFKKALANAQALLKNPTDQKAVDAAVKTLNDASKALKVKAGTQTNNGTKTDGNKQADKKPTANTGVTSAAAWLGASVSLLGAVLFSKKHKD